jgi:hypothetical protein
MPTVATASRERIRRGGYTSRDSAEQALAALRESAFKQGALITVESWLATWLESRIQLRDSTLRSYTQLSRNHLVPHLGHVTLRELQPRQITAMLETAPFRPVPRHTLDRRSHFGRAPCPVRSHDRGAHSTRDIVGYRTEVVA